VAIKVVAPNVKPSQLVELRARLTREARTLASVRHPGVVDVLDGGVLTDGTPYVVMEKLTGRTLEAILLMRTRLSTDNAVAIALQLCSALDAVHHAGIVHRDLKPSNILVARGTDDAERVALVDFGIAQVHSPGDDKLTAVGAIIGTPAYMAPEQLLGHEDIDVRADVYALGVTLFECLTGTIPFTGGYAKIVAQVCVQEQAPSVPPYVEPAMRAILLRALATKREERFPTAAEMALALRAAFPTAPRRTDLAAPASAESSRSVPDQRRAPRAPYATPVRMTLPDGVIDGRSEDISEGGLLVIAGAAPPVNARLSIRFAMPMEGIVVACDARVRWTRSARLDATDGRHALGIEFIDAPAQLTASIARYMELMATKPTFHSA
jgi:serine/threonine-protein kinase